MCFIREMDNQDWQSHLLLVVEAILVAMEEQARKTIHTHLLHDSSCAESGVSDAVITRLSKAAYPDCNN